MAHHVRVRDDLAAWSIPDAAVTAEEFELFDSQLEGAINGDVGGTWAPSGEIEIGGLGIRMTGPFVTDGQATHNGESVFEGDAIFNGELVANGFVTLNNDVEWNGGATGLFTMGSGPLDDFVVEATAGFNADVGFQADAFFFGDVTIGDSSGDTLTVNSTAVFNGPMVLGNASGDFIEVNGEVRFDSPVQIGNQTTDLLTIIAETSIEGDIEILGELVIDGGVSVTSDCVFSRDVQLGTDSGDAIDVIGTMTIQRKAGFASSGRIPFRLFNLPNASDTVSPETDGNVWRANNLTADRTYSVTGGTEGDFFWVVNLDSAQSAIIEFSGGAASSTVSPNKTSLFMAHGTGVWTALITNVTVAQPS